MGRFTGVRLRPLPSALLLVLATLASSAAGCGSDGSGSGYGPKDSSAPTAAATTPAAPPGATARACDGGPPGSEQLRVTGVDCDTGREVAAAWTDAPACAPASGASRSACSAGDGYRCGAATVERGIAVSCARRGASVAFVAELD